MLLLSMPLSQFHCPDFTNIVSNFILLFLLHRNQSVEWVGFYRMKLLTLINVLPLSNAPKLPHIQHFSFSIKLLNTNVTYC